MYENNSYTDLFHQSHQNFVKEAYLAFLVNDKGELLHSNNTLIDLSAYYGESIFQIFPFLESLLIADIPEISMNLIETDLYEKNIKYRCNIKSINRQSEVLFFVVLQNVDWHYQELQRVQQERNEAVIQKEIAFLKHKK
ncbi:MAG: hypothetical protein SFU27_09575 [Thermonemataceae bacterium]|nr:hypothetical protein [Thermonemataceae bacterium]